MAKPKKVYVLLKQRGDNQPYEIKGTLEELCEYFTTHAKSITTLISRVKKKYSEREACCYNRTSIELKKA